MTILNDLMLAESFTKVHFVLNGNNRAHKAAASIIASQMTHLEGESQLFGLTKIFWK